MTKAQAYAMLDAMESVKMGGSVIMKWTNGVEGAFSVQVDPSQVFTGVQLEQLATYCRNQGFALSATFTAIGIT